MSARPPGTFGPRCSRPLHARRAAPCRMHGSPVRTALGRRLGRVEAFPEQRSPARAARGPGRSRAAPRDARTQAMPRRHRGWCSGPDPAGTLGPRSPKPGEVAAASRSWSASRPPRSRTLPPIRAREQSPCREPVPESWLAPRKATRACRASPRRARPDGISRPGHHQRRPPGGSPVRVPGDATSTGGLSIEGSFEGPLRPGRAGGPSRSPRRRGVLGRDRCPWKKSARGRARWCSRWCRSCQGGLSRIGRSDRPPAFSRAPEAGVAPAISLPGAQVRERLSCSGAWSHQASASARRGTNRGWRSPAGSLRRSA